MKKLVVLLFLMVSLFANEDGVKSVVYDLSTGELEKFEQMILGSTPRFKPYYEGQFQELKVAVVIHGDAYKFFVKDISKSPYKDQKELLKVNADLQKRIASAHEIYEVEFIMCEAGMRREKISPEDVYSFIKFVPSQVIGMIDKQNEGYAYVPVK